MPIDDEEDKTNDEGQSGETGFDDHAETLV